MTKYRTDVIDDLMNQVRTHWEHLDNTYQDDGFKRTTERTKNPFTPHQARVDVHQAYTDNMIASQYTNPEVFGRKRKRRAVVKASDSAGTSGRMPPNSSYGTASLPAPTTAGQRGLPRWASREVKYEEAIALIEQRAHVASRKLAAGLTMDDILGREGQSTGSASGGDSATSGDGLDTMATTQAGASDSSGKPTPTARGVDGFEPEQVAGRGRIIPEATNPHFEYAPGDSYFEGLADGAQIAGGLSEWIDVERTQTFFGRPLV